MDKTKFYEQLAQILDIEEVKPENVLKELETWCHELGMRKCILETGRNQPEAIRLYAKNGYERIPNFGRYRESPSSVCFEKSLRS